MSVLLDTCILARLANSSDPRRSVLWRVVSNLRQQGHALHITAQNLVEFRNVATRAAVLNGLGLSVANTESKMQEFEQLFPLLPETPAIFPEWKRVVQALGIIGKQVHDARLMAVCSVHHIDHILTFNAPHFTRIATFLGSISVVAPQP